MPDKQESLSLDSMRILLPLARQGNREALNEICKQIQDYLNVMADRQLGAELRRKVNPSDLVQQTMTRMVDGFDGFRGSTSREFYGWLNAILRNELHRNRRNLNADKRDIRREREIPDRSGSAPAPPVRDPHLTPSSTAIQAEKLQHFRDALRQLSPEHAEVIRLRSLEELPFRDVAERIGKSYDATTKLWYRAIVKLQEVLDEQGNA